MDEDSRVVMALCSGWGCLALIVMARERCNAYMVLAAGLTGSGARSGGQCLRRTCVGRAAVRFL